MPADLSVPLICVGPGTGVAPFRSFLHERAAVKRAGAAVAPCTLFFGCRYRGKDFLYAEARSWVLVADCGGRTECSTRESTWSRLCRSGRS